jgi:hypothetical protein
MAASADASRINFYAPKFILKIPQYRKLVRVL